MTLVSFIIHFVYLEEKYNLKFYYPSLSMWHPFLKWKYEGGHLINLALNLALTSNSGSVSLAETSDSQQWSLDYNGNLYINQ